MLRFLLCLIVLNTSFHLKAASTKDDLYKASIFYDEGNYEKAELAYREIAKSHPEFSGVYFNLANALYKQKKRAGAVAAYLKAYNLDPSDPDIKANLAFAMKDNKDKLSVFTYPKNIATIFYPLIEKTNLERFYLSSITWALFVCFD